MKMRNLITMVFITTVLYLLFVCQVEQTFASLSSGNVDSHHSRTRGISRFRSKSAQYGRIKPETIFNDFGDDDDIFDLSKRQQPPSDDYGHLRFGKRDERFDDYGHMRFGRNGDDMK